MPSVFSQARAIKSTRAGRRVKKGIREVLSTVDSNKKNVAHNIARFVLRSVPQNALKSTDNKYSEMKFKQSFSKSAEQSLAKGTSTGILPCIERCNLALALFREAKVPAWLARQVSFSVTSTKPRVHDYVEFFLGGKVRTLALGIKLEDRADTYNIYNSPLKDVGLSKVFRGIESSQIGGASNYKKYKLFAREAFSTKQHLKNKRRVELLVKSGVIPEKAYQQIMEH